MADPASASWVRRTGQERVRVTEVVFTGGHHPRTKAQNPGRAGHWERWPRAEPLGYV